MPELLLNLLLTWLLETPILAAFLRKRIPFLLIFSLLMNSFTLPLATWAYEHFQINWYLLELAVVATEFLILRLFWNRSYWFLLLAAFTSNLVSACFLPVLEWMGISL
jgi:hypothetical protein